MKSKSQALKKFKSLRDDKHYDKGGLYVIFMLDNERYAMDIGSVQEILKPQSITEIPRTPDYLSGVINLRGRIVPIIDLRLRVGMPVREATKTTRIVVGRHEEQAVGMIVDAVLAVRAVPQRLIEPASPLFAARVDMDFIKGLARLDEGIVTLLDPDRLLRKPGAPAALTELNGNAN